MPQLVKNGCTSTRGGIIGTPGAGSRIYFTQTAQVLMEPSPPLTGHISPTFILQRQTWGPEYQDTQQNEFLISCTKPDYDRV